MTSSASASDAPRASLLVLGTAAFLVQADSRVVDPLLKIIAGDFHVTKEGASIALTLYAFAYGLFQLFYGPLGDRIGKLKVMAAALGAFSLTELAGTFMPSLPLFTVLRFLTGMCAAAVIPLSLGYIGDKFPASERQITLGRFMSALMLGQILGSALGGVFGDYLSWRVIYRVFAGISLVMTLLLLRESQRVPEAPRPERKFSFAPYLTLWAKPMTRVVLVVAFIEGFFIFGGLPFLGASLRERFDLSYKTIGLLLGCFGIGGLIYSASVKKLVPKIGELGTLLLGGSLLLIGYSLIGWLPVWWLFVPAIVIFGMGYYTMHGPIQTRATELAPEMRGTAVALFAFAFFLGQAAGPAVMGQVLKHGGYGVGFPLAGAGLFVLALVARSLFGAGSKAAR
ncbi:MFS transporter [Armatimonas rosea]|uniref:Putative MFS family arabinose efflux permease n=1 Tax=Armatimonas rosea TaxID=685828 RepID=A0A7W9SMZ7_ARMRO|nr:putative MFS family arabinose efflux permease [Armatimonas rosea]